MHFNVKSYIIILIKVNKFKYTTEIIQIKAKQTAIKKP